MLKSWQLQEAKNKFSQVVDEAVKEGPQIVTKHGVETVVVLSYDTYRRLTGFGGPLSHFLRESPLARYEIDVARDTSAPRDEPFS